TGFNFLESINTFFSLDLTNLKVRYAYFCKVIHNEHVLDEIILTYFKGPNSYTGEDVLELSVHGNILNVQRIMNLFLKVHGISTAKPGEFTLRAYNNKKLNLSQVEGLDLLLNANSIFSLDQGYSLLSGKMQDQFKLLAQDFIQHKSALEFAFDFLEDVGEKGFNKLFSESFKKLDFSISKLYQRASNESFNLIKPEVIIYGLPNAGKSTLFNSLLGESRAIVSSTAGTTRDYLCEDISIGETIFSLIDTAGIRVSDDEIESCGIERALGLAKNAFFNILLVNPFEFDGEFYKKLIDIKFDLILVSHADKIDFNKVKQCALLQLEELGFDLAGPIEPTKAGPIEPTKTGPIEPIRSGPIEPTRTGPIEPIFVSLIDPNFDISEVLHPHVLFKYQKLLSFDPVLVERHSASIKAIHNSFQEYKLLVEAEQDMAITASELNIVGHCISELIGIVSPNDVLRNIFKNFCIGK
ncbi:MAG: GTP-binding protein, partial [Halobacteriovoraceae bacterium]|nr:GTP-binding protein [Halobacteriovoraceae bacterium]